MLGYSVQYSTFQYEVYPVTTAGTGYPTSVLTYLFAPNANLQIPREPPTVGRAANF